MEKQEAEASRKKMSEEGAKAEQSRQDLEQKVAQLEMIIDMTAKQAEQHQKTQEKQQADIDKFR